MCSASELADTVLLDEGRTSFGLLCDLNNFSGRTRIGCNLTKITK